MAFIFTGTSTLMKEVNLSLYKLMILLTSRLHIKARRTCIYKWFCFFICATEILDMALNTSCLSHSNFLFSGDENCSASIHSSCCKKIILLVSLSQPLCHFLGSLHWLPSQTQDIYPNFKSFVDSFYLTVLCHSCIMSVSFTYLSR